MTREVTPAGLVKETIAIRLQIQSYQNFPSFTCHCSTSNSPQHPLIIVCSGATPGCGRALSLRAIATLGRLHSSVSRVPTSSISRFKMRFVKPYQLFFNMMKETKGKQGRLLGLDVGDRYVGIAVSDPDNKVASPISVLVRKKTNIDLMASDFNLLISNFSLKGFVVGVPFDRQRAHSEAVLVKTFIDDLSKTGKLEGLQFTYWNECFTSKNVELLLKDLDINPVQYKTMLDKFAAVGILQGYLDFVNRKMKQEVNQEPAK